MNTTTTLHQRTNPAVVKWITNTEHSRQFATTREAVGFALQFNEQQRASVRIEFATGEAMFFPEITEFAL